MYDIENKGIWQLDGPYSTRKDKRRKCYEAAKGRGFHVFALRRGGKCCVSAKSLNTYQDFGRAGLCKADGEGGYLVNQVYIINGECEIGINAVVQISNSCTSRPDVCQCLVVQTPIDNMSKNRPRTSNGPSSLRSYVRSSMHLCPENWVAIGHEVENYARDAQAFSVGIKCRHCIYGWVSNCSF